LPSFQQNPGTEDWSSVQSSVHMRFTLAQINPRLGDIDGNLGLIAEAIDQAIADGAELIVFPELVLTGYSPRDLLLFPDFRSKIDQALENLLLLSHDKNIRLLIGVPLWVPETQRFTNSALGLYLGDMCYVQHKSLLPHYDIFDDRRYFEASQNSASYWPLGPLSLVSAETLTPSMIFSEPVSAVTALDSPVSKVGVLICEDAWAEHESDRYDTDPLLETMALDLDLLIVMMASPYEIGKAATRQQHFSNIASRYNCPVIMVNQVGAHDDLIFDGSSVAIDANGDILNQLPSFQTKIVTIDVNSTLRLRSGTTLRETSTPVLENRDRKGEALSISPTCSPEASMKKHTLTCASLENIYAALVFSLREYVSKTGFSDVVLGLSGGIDSALTAAIAVDALGASHVTGVAMPSRYSSPDSLRDAEALAQSLGISMETVSIDAIHHLYESSLPEVFDSGLAAENVQPRIRGNILMGISNRRNALLLSTGNKSEIAMGYCTLYGDMCGALCVLGDVYKTEVFALSNWRNREGVVIPQNTIDRPPSAELRPDQTDQDSLPPYDLLDAILVDYFENRVSVADLERLYDPAVLRWVMTQFHRNEYKRRQAAVIPRIRVSAFGTGYRVPIVGMMGR
jgi:NAD+ synthase (glutamine-hydrolysing)